MTSVASEAACLPSLRIPLATYGLNRFTLDWIAGDPNATRFLPRDNAAWTLRPDRRDHTLAEALIASNQQWGRDVGDDVSRYDVDPIGQENRSVGGHLDGHRRAPRKQLREAARTVRVEVLQEDLRVQEAYYDLVLPLSPTAEVHTRADRATLELRRVLGDLVAAVDGGGAR